MAVREVISTYVRREIKERFGKVFSIEISVGSDCRILKLVISGDFFAYPPEVLDSLEREVSGRHVSELVEVVSSAIGRVTLVGVSRESVIELFRSAVEEVAAKCR
ncbi:MAG: hypothetical protein RMH84_01150 [Sulfolobales archaeon]|nr:hypothetical protein [Sulfolobales archaeon]MCX8209122.1 hypothetical protein [Sulfolobales archaeon]MDW8010193.1 hypothetical protein [Sulfolobales archaeon]